MWASKKARLRESLLILSPLIYPPVGKPPMKRCSETRNDSKRGVVSEWPSMKRAWERDETYILHDWAPCEAPSSVLSRSTKKLCNPPPPPPPPVQGLLGGYDHDCIGEQVEWRPLLLYANPLGHEVLATPDI